MPTEAQWEFACRAGTSGDYSFEGDEANLRDYAWYGNWRKGRTREVGLKRPNPWGLWDMHGNVWEWCQDWHDSDYYKNSPSQDPTGPASGSERVLRGGSWGYDAGFCRSAAAAGAPRAPGTARLASVWP